MQQDHPGLRLELPGDLLQRGEKQWVENARSKSKKPLSTLHRDISDMLMQMRIPHKNEAMIEGDLFSLDMRIEGEVLRGDERFF